MIIIFTGVNLEAQLLCRINEYLLSTVCTNHFSHYINNAYAIVHDIEFYDIVFEFFR